MSNYEDFVRLPLSVYEDACLLLAVDAQKAEHDARRVR